MIIIVAALEFATQAKRDEAVALTADVQQADSARGAGVLRLLLCPRSRRTDANTGV